MTTGGITRTALLIALTITLAGCRSVAATLFDLPENAAPEPTAQAFGVNDAAAADTTPPAIEAVREPDSVLASLPRHASGGIDWLTAEETGVIRPRPAPPRATREYLSGFGYDLILKGPNVAFDAVFPHSRHVTLLSCATCHPTVFRYRENDNSMRAIGEGRSCGTCHGSVAFPTAACGRCHTAMPPGEETARLEDDLVLARAEADGEGPAVELPRSRFPHWLHRIRYRCSACHNTLFAMKSGADTLTMAEMSGENSCGACHDGYAAFGLRECMTCHAEPRKAAPSEP